MEEETTTQKTTYNDFIMVRLSRDQKLQLQKLADKEERKLSEFCRMQLVKLVK